MSNNTNNQTVTRVMVVDDHPMLRKGLIQLMSWEPRLDPVAEASSGDEAVKMAKDINPDLILLDLNMPERNGLSVLKELKALQLDAKIVVFTVSDEPSDIYQALKSGADGYLLKDMEPEQLISKILYAIDGKIAFSPELENIVDRALIDRVQNKGGKKEHHITLFHNITDRENEVLELISNGMSNKMIARELEIAEGTVKVHVRRLLNKLGARSRVEAAVMVMENKS